MAKYKVLKPFTGTFSPSVDDVVELDKATATDLTNAGYVANFYGDEKLAGASIKVDTSSENGEKKLTGISYGALEKLWRTNLRTGSKGDIYICSYLDLGEFDLESGNYDLKLIGVDNGKCFVEVYGGYTFSAFSGVKLTDGGMYLLFDFGDRVRDEATLSGIYTTQTEVTLTKIM